MNLRRRMKNVQRKNRKPKDRNGGVLKKRGRPRKVKKDPKLEMFPCVPLVRCDSEIVKEKIIDLVDNNDVFFTCLRFARVCDFETGIIIESFEKQAQLSEEPCHFVEATVCRVEVLFHITDERCIDLTSLENDNISLNITSEKECANEILPIILKFHTLVNQKMEEDFEEIPEEQAEDRISLSLVQTLSQMFVKNLNMSRLLQIIVLKLEQKYDIIVKPKCVCSYLYSMLVQNVDINCERHSLPQQMLQEAENYYFQVEAENSEGQQLQVLQWQIQKYLEFAAYLT